MERTPALKPLLLLGLDGVLRTVGGAAIPEALALVRTAKQQCFVAVLSDTAHSDTEIDTEVDAVFNSSRLGLAKPDPAIYRRVLAEFGYSTGVFCDDTAENAAAAREAGLDGVHVPDTATLRTALAVRGLIPATVLLVLPDRDEAEELASSLLEDGWGPCEVHRDMLAGEDDAEDVDWVVELTTAPDGTPASAHREELDDLAERHDGFTSEH
ncbi:HAD-IA family hydrolase [Lentzea sp. NPDC059081]|uniref:HAD-IA family hydrolase n=1 Tax=Lentzea sp. NPDC059081 TaxID=3346719 RepID=UPI0036A657B2